MAFKAINQTHLLNESFNYFNIHNQTITTKQLTDHSLSLNRNILIMPTSRQKLILQFPGINYHQSLLFRILLLLLGAEVILCGNISCERTNFLFSSCLNNPDNELTVCGVKESENYNSENQLRLTFPTICLAC